MNLIQLIKNIKYEYSRIKSINYYAIDVKNPTNEKHELILFGYDIFLKDANYGSSPSLDISNHFLTDIGGYYFFLAQTTRKKLNIEKIHLISNNTKQFLELILNNVYQASGEQITYPVFKLKEIKDGICLTPTKKLKVTPNSFLSTKILPKTDILILIYYKQGIIKTLIQAIKNNI